MKNSIIKTLKVVSILKKVIFVFFALFCFISYSQSWDYINFQQQSNNTVPEILGATIDANDNIYCIENLLTYSSATITRRLSKYSNGLLVTTSPFNFGVNFTPGDGNPSNSITSGPNNIYLVGSGKIYRIDHTLTTRTLIRNITTTNGSISLNSVFFSNGKLYISGNLYDNNVMASVNFGNNYSAVPVTNEAFVAIYDINGTCLSVTKIGDSHFQYKTDIVVATNGDIFATYANATDTPSTHRVVKKLNAIGNIDVQWGTKNLPVNPYNVHNIDIKCDPDNSSIYVGSGNLVLKYNATSTGALIQTKNFSSDVYIKQLIINNCGLVGITGGKSHQIGSSFYSASYDKNTNGSIINWSSNGSSSNSEGVGILSDTYGKFNILGSHSSTITISGSNISPTSQPFSALRRAGTFIGRVDNSTLNSGAKAAASFINPIRIIQKDSKYGPGDVAILCLSSDLLVDGSLSSCESGYFVGLSIFDLDSWVDIGTPLYANWVSPNGQAPSDIKITEFLPQGYQLRPNKVYKFRLAVGSIWDAVDLFFMIDCCSEL